MKLPKFLSSKSDKRRFKMVVITFLLILGSTAFLLTGPRALEIVENKVVSENLVPEAVKLKNMVLTEVPSPKPPTVKLISLGISAPLVTAVSTIAYDTDTGEILYQKNVNTRLAPASTTKIMTALVGIEQFNNSDLLVVPAEALVGGSRMGLTAGERLTFRSLLYGMMLNSGNDAAFTIAMNYPGGLEGFVAKMNEKAKQLGLQNTHFDNPAGFDSPTHYSSAYDLLQIGKEAMRNARLGKVFSTKETSVTSIDQAQIRELKNLNKLLGEDGVMGIKTGTTEMAGESLVGLSEKNGHTILTVMLNSKDRFNETKSLLDWIFKNFSWQVS